MSASMLNSFARASFALCLQAAAIAQTDAAARIHPITSPLKEGGTLHVASGTWTRGPLPAGLGQDVLYNNTCPSAFFSGIGTDTYTDEGRVPSPTSPAPTPATSSQPGCAVSYVVDGFQIAYCTDRTTATEVRLDFYSAYASCATIPTVPTASFDLTGLPHSPSNGLSSCWTLNVDLTAAGSPGSTFTLAADADGSFDGPIGLDTFGWSFRMPSNSLGAYAGPLIAGNPAQCLGFDGTAWDPAPNMAEAGTGMGTRDQFYLESTSLPSGCYYFGSSGPFASFHLKLYGDTCAVSGPEQVAYCFGGNTCPCSNAGAPGHGCANSVNHLHEKSTAIDREHSCARPTCRVSDGSRWIRPR